jgi:hypothetical protein
MSSLYNKALGLLFVCTATLATGCAIDTAEDETSQELLDEERNFANDVATPRSDHENVATLPPVQLQIQEREQDDPIAAFSVTDEEEGDGDDEHEDPDPTPWNGNPTPQNSHGAEQDEHDQREDPDPTPWAATAVSGQDQEPDPQPWATR